MVPALRVVAQRFKGSALKLGHSLHALLGIHGMHVSTLFRAHACGSINRTASSKQPDARRASVQIGVSTFKFWSRNDSNGGR
jgi:hypothetical protein